MTIHCSTFTFCLVIPFPSRDMTEFRNDVKTDENPQLTPTNIFCEDCNNYNHINFDSLHFDNIRN